MTVCLWRIQNVYHLNIKKAQYKEYQYMNRCKGKQCHTTIHCVLCRAKMKKKPVYNNFYLKNNYTKTSKQTLQQYWFLYLCKCYHQIWIPAVFTNNYTIERNCLSNFLWFICKKISFLQYQFTTKSHMAPLHPLI